MIFREGTLLNLLFGTNFLVMEAAKGRVQTTKGVWMGLSASSDKEEKVFVFDVEGTDSRERGEHHAVRYRPSFFFVGREEMIS